VGLFSAEGTSIYGTNTDIEGFLPHRIEGDAEVRLALEGLSLVEGTYLLDLAAHRRDGTPYDYLRGQHSFRVKSRTKDVGVYRPLHRWSFAGAPRSGPPSPAPSSSSATSRVPDAAPAYAGTMSTVRPKGPSRLATPGRAARVAGDRPPRRPHQRLLRPPHPGHVALLEAARREGEVLVVALNSDASVRGLKGAGRPVVPEAERAEALLALEAVDRVVLYDEPTPLAVISTLRPDVLVKGADWAAGEIVGRAEVEEGGGRVVRVALVPGRSTSALVGRIRQP